MHPQDRAFLEAAFSAYLSAMAYAETEKEVSKILNNRLTVPDDQKLTNFISETYGKGQGRIKRSDIAELVKRFGDDCKNHFTSNTDERVITQYSNMLECRHSLAHGEPKNSTITSIEDGINAASALLDALNRAIK